MIITLRSSLYGWAQIYSLLKNILRIKSIQVRQVRKKQSTWGPNRKIQKFSVVFRGPLISLFIQTDTVSRHETLQLCFFPFYDSGLEDLLKKQVSEIGDCSNYRDFPETGPRRGKKFLKQSRDPKNSTQQWLLTPESHFVERHVPSTMCQLYNNLSRCLFTTLEVSITALETSALKETGQFRQLSLYRHEPTTSAMPVQCSTNWAMKPHSRTWSSSWAQVFLWKDSVNEITCDQAQLSISLVSSYVGAHHNCSIVVRKTMNSFPYNGAWSQVMNEINVYFDVWLIEEINFLFFLWKFHSFYLIPTWIFQVFISC